MKFKVYMSNGKLVASFVKADHALRFVADLNADGITIRDTKGQVLFTEGHDHDGFACQWGTALKVLNKNRLNLATDKIK